MARPKLTIALKITVCCLLIGYLLFKVDISKIAAAVKNVDLPFYLLSTAIAVLSNIFVAAKYYILIMESPINHSFISLFKINIISSFYALFLPSAGGRDFVRWVKVTRNQKGRGAFITSIVFERVTFLLMLLLCGLIPLLFLEPTPAFSTLRMRLQPLIILMLAIIAASLSLYLSANVRFLAKSIAERIFKHFFDKLNIGTFIESFALHNMRGTYLAGIVGLSLVWQIFYVGSLYALTQAAALSFNVIDIVWMGSLVLLLQTLPISFAGIGLREGAYAYLFTMYGLPPEEGVLIGILFFSQILIVAFMGGVLELVDK